MVAVVPTRDSTKKRDDAKVQVFVRIRPLIAEERGQEAMDYKINDTNTAIKLKVPSLEDSNYVNHVNHALTPPPLKNRIEDQWKTFSGFTSILQQDCNNQRVYQTTLRPLVQRIAQQPNQSACLFTYGHTGSGKSHTLLGYDDSDLGIYKHAAQELLTTLQSKDPSIGLNVRVTELYKDQVLDLMDQQKCTIRQDAKGTMQLRGPMIEDEEGRMQQQPLGKFCPTPQLVMLCVVAACASRRVGTSTHHSQSSRSHLVMEFEVVTLQFLEERENLHDEEAQLNRLKWLQTERMARRKQPEQLPKWTEEYQEAGPSKLRREIQEYEGLVAASRKRIKKLLQSQPLGGTLVICDLAGNEYAQDSRTSTKEELEEAAEINKSLLAVKEVIRSLGNSTTKQQHNHVPYRDSKLTMMLRRHLNHRAAMMAHISPSQESIRKTMNTLKYASMVAKTTSTTTNATSTTSASPIKKKASSTPKSTTSSPGPVYPNSAKRRSAGPKPWLR